jgi:hypothetical protein
VFTFREVADGMLFALTITLQGHATPTRCQGASLSASSRKAGLGVVDRNAYYAWH